VFKQPNINGTFEFRFFAQRFGRVATSAPIVIANTDAVVVKHNNNNENNNNGNATLTVSVTLSTSNPSRYWVGIYHVNEERPNKYRRYSWLSQCVQDVQFKTPVHSGTYEARVYDASNALVVKSACFTIA
jgi:hypothetical protein